MRYIIKKVSIFSYLSFLLFSLNSCIGGLGFVYKEHLFGNYYLVAMDVIEQCSLSYHTENDKVNFGGTIIGQTVFAVGYNEKYLIAKQYYHNNPDRTIDKSKINYYILPLIEGMNWRTKNGLIGPVDSLTFENIRKNIGISQLKFTKTVDI